MKKSPRREMLQLHERAMRAVVGIEPSLKTTSDRERLFTIERALDALYTEQARLFDLLGSAHFLLNAWKDMTMKTSINIVLDRSGSMGTLRNDTIGGFNTFLAEQKAAPGEAFFTLTQFNDSYDVMYDSVPIKDVKPLDEKTYQTTGNTCLLDAIGRTIDSTGQKLANMRDDERPERVLVVIITDGEENSSKEYKLQRVRDMIAHQRDVYKWDFVFLGAGEEAIKGGQDLGMMDAMAYKASGVGTQELYSGVSRGVARYRMGADVKEIRPDASMEAHPDKDADEKMKVSQKRSVKKSPTP